MVLNALLLALEAQGLQTSWPKADDASLAVSIDGEAVRVSVSEITDSLPHVLTPAEAKHPWSAPKHDYRLTGRLQLQVANLPPYMGPIRRTWADGKYQQVENAVTQCSHLFHQRVIKTSYSLYNKIVLEGVT